MNKRVLRWRSAGLMLLFALAVAPSAGAQEGSIQEAQQLTQQAIELRGQGQYDKAIPLAQRALAIREKAMGPEHPDTAISLNNLADLYHATGAYAKAEPLYQRALAIREKALGPEHPDTATSLNNLALLYYTTGAYAKAEPLFQRALAINEKALGPEHPNTATSLNNLADLYQATGAYAKAEPLYQRALAIREKARGPEHPDTANSLSNLAWLYYTTGAYAKAEPLFQRALAIREKAMGPEHPDTATSLNNLAELYRATGAHAKAEPLYQRALAITEKALGPEHPNTAISLSNLAALYRATGAYAKAEPLFQRALAINEKALGPEHPNTAISLSNLAVLYKATGAYAKAEPLYQRALAITINEKALGPEHPHTASSLNNLALLYDTTGAYTKAEPLFQRALAITYLTSGRDLLRFATDSSSRSSAVVVADPDYGPSASVVAKADNVIQPSRSGDLDRSGLVFEPLDGTAAEAKALQALLKLADQNVLTGANATEAKLKRLHGPRNLHLATHGFFLNDKEMAAVALKPVGLTPDPQSVPMGENPLLRSGLALAGANPRRSGANDDGILTAAEAAQLDLIGTQLVVLSACETGVGEVQNGEGVYGLRRALVLAGAQTQLASLWKVADTETKELMVDYYQRLLKGEGRSGALRASQKAMIASQDRWHPFYWAAFVPIGNWAPLPAPH